MSPMWVGFSCSAYKVEHMRCVLWHFLRSSTSCRTLIVSNEDMWNYFIHSSIVLLSLKERWWWYWKYVCTSFIWQMETFESVLLFWYWIRWMSLLGKQNSHSFNRNAHNVKYVDESINKRKKCFKVGIEWDDESKRSVLKLINCCGELHLNQK